MNTDDARRVVEEMETSLPQFDVPALDPITEVARAISDDWNRCRAHLRATCSTRCPTT